MSSSMPATTLPATVTSEGGGKACEGRGWVSARMRHVCVFAHRRECVRCLGFSFIQQQQELLPRYEAEQKEGSGGQVGFNAPKRQLWQHRPQRHTSKASGSVLPKSNNPLIQVLFMTYACSRALASRGRVLKKVSPAFSFESAPTNLNFTTFISTYAMPTRKKIRVYVLFENNLTH